MNKLYCLGCPTGCLLTIIGSGLTMMVDGGQCPKGAEFAENELSNTHRTLTTTVRTNFPDVPVISVRTDGEIPKESFSKAMGQINKIVVTEELGVGDVLIEDVAETGVSVIVTSPALMQLGAELENKNAELGRVGASKNVGSAAFEKGGVGAVRNVAAGNVTDDIGDDYVGGFIGAAGQAVGVADEDTGDTSDESGEAPADEKSDGKEIITRRSRARIDR